MEYVKRPSVFKHMSGWMILNVYIGLEKKVQAYGKKYVAMQEIHMFCMCVCKRTHACVALCYTLQIQISFTVLIANELVYVWVTFISRKKEQKGKFPCI